MTDLNGDARSLLGMVVEIVGRSGRSYREWLEAGPCEPFTGRSLLSAEDFAYEFVVHPDLAVRVTGIRHPITHEWVPFDPPLTVRLDRLADETRLWRDVMQDKWWSDPNRAGTVLKPRTWDYPIG